MVIITTIENHIKQNPWIPITISLYHLNSKSEENVARTLPYHEAVTRPKHVCVGVARQTHVSCLFLRICHISACLARVRVALSVLHSSHKINVYHPIASIQQFPSILKRKDTKTNHNQLKNLMSLPQHKNFLKFDKRK